MLNKVGPEKIFCGLDIGSQSIKVGILKVKDQGHLELLGVFESKTQGYKDGAVSDMNELAESVQKSVDALSKRMNSKIKEVYLGINGELVDTRETNSLVPLVDRGTKIISQGDVSRVNYQARLLGIKMDEEIIHEVPQDYLVDDMDSILQPVGLYGRKMGVRSLIVVSSSNRVRNVAKAIHEAGYDVTGVFFTSLMSAEVVLSEADKKEFWRNNHR